MAFYVNMLPPDVARRIAIDPDTSCWLWTGYVNTNGYGRTQRQGVRRYVHQITYEHFHGPVRDGLEIDHLCRVRACCNPLHLQAVPHLVNTLRSESPLAQNARKTHCPQGHAFAQWAVYRPTGGRRCRLCRREERRRQTERETAAKINGAPAGQSHREVSPGMEFRH